MGTAADQDKIEEAAEANAIRNHIFAENFNNPSPIFQ
jgi:hypothetical protein